jgi:hypothetical protein
MASVVGLTRIWATGPQTPNQDPGLTKWALGWISEIPTLQVLNYINNRNDTNQLALAERGVFQWTGAVSGVAGVAYKLGALVWDEADSVIYRAKVANPSTATRPGLNLSQWEPSSIQISRAAYDANAAAWAAHIANTSNPHGLTAHQLGSYTTVEIDAKIAVVDDAIDDHVNIVAGNPHGTTYADVGAVSVGGGVYTGVVNHRYAQTLYGPANDGSMNATAAGVYIGKGATARLGINASNQPVSIDAAGVVSVLLTEASYVAQRTAQAPLYATPTPDSWLVAKNGAILLTGAGATAFTGPAGRNYVSKDGITHTSQLNVPRLTQVGMMLTAGEDALVYPGADNIQNFANYTLHLDFRVTTGGNHNYVICKSTSTNGYGYINSVGTALNYTFYVAGVVNVLKFADVVAGSDHKCTVTYNGTTLTLFLDGVQVNSLAVTPEAFTNQGFNFGTNGTAGVTCYIREFMTWARALTVKQVSQL